MDDHVQALQMNMETAREIPGEKRREKHAIISQNTFNRVLTKARGRGMKVNTGKTSMLCISDAMSFKADGYLVGEDGSRVGSEDTDTIKILGFHFGRKPNVAEHVKSLRRRFYSRWWVLYHLKHHGFNQEELARIYKTVVRPVFDYCAVVYHPLLNDDQDQLLDRLQRQALKIIYGRDMTYTEMKKKAGITTLRQRRVELSDKFASKCVDSSRFSEWFPLRATGRSRSGSRSRGGEKYLEGFARCKRLFNSPLYFMRRRLNGKPGLPYWERNRDLRDRV